MNKLALALCLATSLAVPPAAPAQSCLFSSLSGCLGTFPGDGALMRLLQAYCSIARFALCDLGF
jgi:hypothetical protein